MTDHALQPDVETTSLSMQLVMTPENAQNLGLGCREDACARVRRGTARVLPPIANKRVGQPSVLRDSRFSAGLFQWHLS